MKPTNNSPFRQGTIWLVVAIIAVFGIEIATNSLGNDPALLKLGALPDNGQLHGEFWRIATYSFLHFNWLHVLVNAALLLWVGRIVERQVGTANGAIIYFVSVLFSAAIILLAHDWQPKPGATVGASGGIFGLLAAAVIISYRQRTDDRLLMWLWIVLAIGFGVSLLPDISMAGHIGGIIGGALTATMLKVLRNEN